MEERDRPRGPSGRRADSGAGQQVVRKVRLRYAHSDARRGVWDDGGNSAETLAVRQSHWAGQAAKTVF